MRKRNLLFSLTLAIFVVGTATPVLAHSGHPEHDGTIKAESSETSERGTTPNRMSKEGETEASKFRTRGQELLGQLKKERQEHTKEERRKNCQTRKQGLQTKLNNLAENMGKHKSRIDAVFSKVLAYQQAHNLNVQNYEALVTTATAAQTSAESSVAALASLKPTLDCNNESVASDVAAFKVAATQARSDLSEYRQAVKSILRAVQAAKKGGEQ